MSAGRVAVIGGGASGLLAALHLLKAGQNKVTLIERAHRPGRGVAYSTRRPEHLLNVPARRMSAFADAPDHFAAWYAAKGYTALGGSAEGFAPRMVYGDYLEELLAGAGDRIETVAGDAVAVTDAGVALADGRRIAADAAILALGNFRPATPRPLDPEALGRLYLADPWAADVAEGLGAGDVILLLGTGLTAVDAALTLDASGFAGRILALSRRGLAPRGHGPRDPADTPGEKLPSNCVALLRRVRARSEEAGWRSAVHELRAVTQSLWASASPAEQARFLRHLRPWWDVHRHKIAPAIFERIAAMQAAGRLAVRAGRVLDARADGGTALVRIRPRGSDGAETIRAARIVNCTGPEADIARSGEPLLAALIAQGAARPPACGIGIEVDDRCRVAGAGGALYAIGPLTRGTFWESVAVPDIRVQAEMVAGEIALSPLR